MISYAQNFEDVILERFFKDIDNGFYVDIGAACPTFHSVTKHFYDKGWRGINIEPSPRLFNDLIRERERDINLNVLITNHDGHAEFFDLENTGLSSIYENNVISAERNQNQLDYFGGKLGGINNLLLESKRLTTIFEQYANNTEIDFLKIDVEGAETEVIESNNWSFFRPKVLIIEATIPNSQVSSFESWDKILVQAKYIFVYFDGLNRYYLRDDLLFHKNVFSYPPCVFDEVLKYSEFQKQVQLTDLQTQHQDLRTQHQELQTQHQELQTQHRELQLINNTMLTSSSWRITFPLRFIKKTGVRTINRIKIRMMISSIKIIIEFIANRLFNFLIRIQFWRRKVLFNIETPGGSIVRPVANEVIFTGWCFQKNEGQLPDKVLVKVNEIFYECEMQPRKDVVSYFSTKYPELWLHNGFKAIIQIPKGLFLVKIIADFKEIGPVKISNKILWVKSVAKELPNTEPIFINSELNDSNISPRVMKIYKELKNIYD